VINDWSFIFWQVLISSAELSYVFSDPSLNRLTPWSSPSLFATFPYFFRFSILTPRCDVAISDSVTECDVKCFCLFIEPLGLFEVFLGNKLCGQQKLLRANYQSIDTHFEYKVTYLLQTRKQDLVTFFLSDCEWIFSYFAWHRCLVFKTQRKLYAILYVFKSREKLKSFYRVLTD